MLLHRCSVAFALVFLAAGLARSADADLDGNWYESNNYPASSVMRFERAGDLWVGKYIHVSARQQLSGFTKGETVIRGTFNDEKFNGEVLLKLSDWGAAQCPNFKAYWTPIEMKLIGPGKLYGAWLQETYDARNGCTVLSRQWQVYGLERLKLD